MTLREHLYEQPWNQDKQDHSGTQPGSDPHHDSSSIGSNGLRKSAKRPFLLQAILPLLH